MNSAILRLAVVTVALTAVGGAASGDPPHEGRVGRLDMPGGFLAGTLVPVAETDHGTRGTFLWQSPHFRAPFEFLIGEVSGITYPVERAAAAPPGQSVHLRGGDVLVASIESLDADAVVVSTAGPAGPQRLRIARAEVVAITRNGAGGGSYVGPAGLDGWQETPERSWRDEAGRIATDKAGSSVTRDVAAPARARYAIQLAGQPTSEFRVAVAAAERPADDGYVLQAVGGEETGGLMIVRRAGGRAAIEPLPPAPWRNGVLRIVLFVDQARGTLAAVLPDLEGADARKVFEVALPAAAAGEASGRFRLELTGGTIRLDTLEITSWRGDEPTLRDATSTAVVSRGGPMEGFSVTSFDAARGEFVLARGTETRRLAAADVDEIRFPDGSGDEAREEAPLQVRQADGGVLSGDLVKVDERAVWLRRRGIDAAVAVPVEGIVTMRGQRPSAGREESPGRLGTLVVGDDRVRGRLVGDETAPGGVAWKPLGSQNAAPLVGGPFDAEVEYRPRRPAAKAATVEVGGIGGLVNRDAEGFFIVAMLTAEGAAAQDGRIQAGDRILFVAPTTKSQFVETKDLDSETVMHLLRGRVGTTVRLKMTDGAGANPRELELVRQPINVAGGEILAQALQAHERLGGHVEPDEDRDGHPAVIVLRSGDVAPCRIEAIDADGVLLRTPLAAGGDAEALRVPAELVKAVELVPGAASRTLDKTLVDRLLTLPRMQRTSPPTHVLRLMNGDYLRGRLERVDDATVAIEVVDTMKKLPRRQVARIIWLHPEVPRDGDADTASEEPEAEAPVVQGVSPDGQRVTLVAEGVEDNLLRGRSRAFGGSGIDLTRIDRLLIGDAIGRDGRELPYARWRLTPAAEPRALATPDGQ